MKRHACSRCGAAIVLEKACSGASGYECRECGHIGIVGTPREPPETGSKYHNQPTVVDGIRFDSKMEAERYGELRLMEKAGQIRDLRRQVSYNLDVNGHHICRYVADFVYLERVTKDCFLQMDMWRLVTEDTKGEPNEVYPLKKKLMKALFDIDIRETGKEKG